jgi:hypothetical protein
VIKNSSILHSDALGIYLQVMITTLAGKKYHGEGKIGENHNICGKIA